jgi:hypothetical protein
VINEHKAHARLKDCYQKLFESADQGARKYETSTNIGVHRATTAANEINDLIFAELINNFDGVQGITPVFDKRKNLRFLKIDGRPPIHLWVKKTTRGHASSNYPTRHNGDLLKKRQIQLFPNATILTLGYLRSSDHKGVSRISITPPCGRGSRPEWWIDIVMPYNVVGMPGLVGPNSVRIVVRRSSDQKTLGA